MGDLVVTVGVDPVLHRRNCQVFLLGFARLFEVGKEGGELVWVSKLSQESLTPEHVERGGRVERSTEAAEAR